MPCTHVRLPNGAFAIVKTARPPRKRCHECRDWSGFLCDYDLGGKTCDRPMCGRHAYGVGTNQHHCVEHHRPERF